MRLIGDAVVSSTSDRHEQESHAQSLTIMTSIVIWAQVFKAARAMNKRPELYSVPLLYWSRRWPSFAGILGQWEKK